MIEHIWTVVCSRAVVDQRSNNISLENIIEQVSVAGAPAPGTGLRFPLDVMSLWTRADLSEPDQGQGRLRFLSPSGETIAEREFEINVSGDIKRYRANIHLEGLPLKGEGQYTFHTDFWDGSEWREVASIPLEIVFEPPRAEKGAAPSV